MMKSYHELAWKELSAQKLTSALILIAIVLSTMMTTVIGQSWGTLQALREQQAGMLNGFRYATFHNLTRQQKAILEQDSRLSFVGSNIILGTASLKNSGMSLQLREYDEQDLAIYPSISQLVKGRLPQKAEEIALPEDALDYLGFSGNIGDTIILDFSISLLKDTEAAYEYQAGFTLCGILQSNYIGYSSGIVTGIAGDGAAEKWLPEKYQLYSTDFLTAVKRDFQETVDDLIAKMTLPKSHIQMNDLYLAALGISYDQEDSASEEGGGLFYLAVTGLMIGALVLTAAGLVIYNVLKIAVSKRIKAYGVLRAIGAERGQLYRLVAQQLFLLLMIGLPIGAVCGVLSARGITNAATGFFSPEVFMVQTAEELGVLVAENSTGKLLPLLISVVITLVFSFLAAMPAARYAAKVSPVIAIRGTKSNVKRKNRDIRVIRNFEAFYARLNLKRNAGRSAITILSLVMSITVFVALQSFSGLLDASRNVQRLHLGDYSVTNDAVGFAPSVLEELKSQKGIAAVYTLKYSLYMPEKSGALPIETGFKLKPGETLQIAGVDGLRLKTLAPSVSEDGMQMLKEGKACLIKNPQAIAYEGKQAETTSFKPGDWIPVTHTQLQVLGNCSAVGLDNQGFVNGVQVVVYDQVYDKLTGKNVYSELYPVLENGAEKGAVEQKIQQICARIPGSRWLSYEKTDKQLAESFQQIKLLAWGLILLIGFIGLLNIINTTYTSIHTRINEIGIQRAIGMSTASLFKTFLWEGAYYGMIAGVIGAVAGYICVIIVEAAATNQVKFVALPVVPILQATAVSIMACLTAVYLPLRQIAKVSIVESNFLFP